jgi:hypothetical protein
MITASVNYDTDGQTTAETIVKVAYANDGVSAHLAWADDDDDAWEVGLGYTAGAMSFSVVAAENDGALCRYRDGRNSVLRPRWRHEHQRRDKRVRRLVRRYSTRILI